MALLQEVFGSSRENIWRELSAQIDGQYVPGTLWKGDKVEAKHGAWTLTLDYHLDPGNKVAYTRMRAPYINPSGFHFRIYRRSSLSGLGKMLGMQDIEVGAKEFDEAFIVQGNHEAKVRQLLSKETIRELISLQPKIDLAVKDDEGWFGPTFPGGVDELQFRAVGRLKDIEQLKGLYELFAAILDELCRMGSAYKTDPHVDLR